MSPIATNQPHATLVPEGQRGGAAPGSDYVRQPVFSTQKPPPDQPVTCWTLGRPSLYRHANEGVVVKVLVVGLNYRPEPTGIAPYTAAFCEGLVERGHQVRVLTTMPHYPEWRVGEGYGG